MLVNAQHCDLNHQNVNLVIGNFMYHCKILLYENKIENCSQRSKVKVTLKHLLTTLRQKLYAMSNVGFPFALHF